MSITYALKFFFFNRKNLQASSHVSSTSHSTGPQHAKSYLRLSKDNLYMILALWMENFVDEPPKDHNKVGAVLVLPNDIVCAADCSRDGVHAVARLLMNHYDKADGSKMFMSRKPCPMCAKLLVQSKVQRVLFLPFEPEYYRVGKNDSNISQMKQVDSLFTASPIAQTRFVLKVEDPILKDAERKTSQKKDIDQPQIDDEKKRLDETIGFEKRAEWIKSITKDPPWPEFDKEMQSQVSHYFDNAVKWVAREKVIPGRGLNYKFQRCSASDSNESGDGNSNESGDGNSNESGDGNSNESGDGNNNESGDGDDNESVDDDNVKSTKNPVPELFDPVTNTVHTKQARHFITMARFLSERTDDPKTGVGAVIVSYPEMEILSFGWNGFPLKALYGEFPRASKDDSIEDKKYPYIIHAEQNALLMRNTKNIKDKNAILFVTKSPCNECTPLIAMQGIRTVVVDDKEDVMLRDNASQRNALDYKMFPDLVKKGEFVCFQTKPLQQANVVTIRLSKSTKDYQHENQLFLIMS